MHQRQTVFSTSCHRRLRRLKCFQMEFGTRTTCSRAKLDMRLYSVHTLPFQTLVMGTCLSPIAGRKKTCATVHLFCSCVIKYLYFDHLFAVFLRTRSACSDASNAGYGCPTMLLFALVLHALMEDVFCAGSKRFEVLVREQLARVPKLQNLSCNLLCSLCSLHTFTPVCMFLSVVGR